MRPGAFASAVAGRHGSVSGRWSRPALLLRASPRPTAARRVISARHEHLHRSVRLNIRVHHATFVDRRSSVVRRERATGSAFLQRIITRTVTRPVPVSSGMPATPRPNRVPAAVAPVARVVRERVAQAEPPRPSPETRFDIKPIRPGLNRPVPPAAGPLPPVELERVTDHVLRSLDRKMSSWRDRRGRS